ncbi:hypothetical protein F5X68DRAFT_19422 [Plectosphaerella plurivora]|uniref:Uncharacterized protein n=1 Tax=Plectosphaerella plurivora TaxID=936078 RepID=A0A9P8VA47_9PEZI|nr:hypothetical protein F5X68DRAFT_19422 [Plectosphaerella plurivora]
MLDPRHQALACQTAVASDYYGLGVRLGIYFVWLQAFIANTLLSSAIPAAADTNTVFLLTLLIAMLNDAVAGTLSQVDGLVLMQLCGGTLFGTLSIWGYRTRLYKDHGPAAVRLFGGYGTHIRVVICFAVSAFGLWFWGWGVSGKLDPMTALEGIEPPNPEECGVTYVFFFAKLRADGGIRYYYLIICASCAAWFGAMVFASGLAAWFTVSGLLGSIGKSWAGSARASAWSRPRFVTGFKTTELVFLYKVFRIFNIAWLIFSALMVEFTLNFNHINGVLGGPHNDLSNPGQLLPFLVGLFGFVGTLYAVIKDRYFPKPEEGVLSPTALDFDFSNRPISSQGRSNTRDRRLDQQQEKRSVVVRYLVAWMPWLGLLQRFDEELVEQGISREGTGLDGKPLSPRSTQLAFIPQPYSPVVADTTAALNK